MVWVYLLASMRNGTLYCGVTAQLAARICEHKEGRCSKFVKKYNVTHLVYAEEYESITTAIAREASIKKWPRQYKLNLIESMNPNWDDLYETIV